MLRLQSIIGSISRRGTLVAASAVAALGAGGCLEKGFLDQTELGAFPKETLVVPILDRLATGIEEPDATFPNAEPPIAADLIAPEGDYPLSPGDLIAVSITDLVAQGVETVQQRRITDTGNISLPYINQIKIAGLTEAQAEEAVSRAYRDAQIIQNAQVAVITIEPLGRTYVLGGAVGRSGTYPIRKNDLRLMEALANAADFDVTRGTRGYKEIFIIRKEIFIIRKRDGDATVLPQPDDGSDTPTDMLRPRGQLTPGDDRLRQATYLRAQPTDPDEPAYPADPSSAQPPATQPMEGEGRYVIIDGKPVLVGGAPALPDDPDAPMSDEPSPGMPGETPPAMADLPPMDTDPFEFNAPQEPTDTRVIRIPVEKLVRGELKYNVVVRPGDTIWVPAPLEGVYYMAGHVQRGGVYGLGNGNDVTLMNAIAAAGGLDQLAVPWRTQIMRRVGNNHVFVTVDLTKITNGLEPDIYIKKDDQITVGTQFWAPFAAAFRNGFRITYGFGFLYDRNYYDRNNNR